MEDMTIIEFETFLVELDKNITKLKTVAAREGDTSASNEAKQLSKERSQLVEKFFRKLTAWDKVLLARHKDRPYTLDYVAALCDDFLELHGDRAFGDDGAVVGGFARMSGRSLMLIGQQKGRDLKERQRRNFGYMKPEGYRKALRLMEMAERFSRPVLTFIDTPGADPNVPSEQRGISEAIARNLREMSVLKTPTVAVVVGEGGSGGALGLAVADRVLMLEHSFYSVIAPEGCASILYRDTTRGADAAKAMRVTAQDALELGLIDEIITEPLGGAHLDITTTAENLEKVVSKHIDALTELSIDDLLEQRGKRLRALGKFENSVGRWRTAG